LIHFHHFKAQGFVLLILFHNSVIFLEQCGPKKDGVHFPSL
jgi:hypothetical protein